MSNYNHNQIEKKWSRNTAGFRSAQQGEYDHKLIEKKWQDEWEKQDLYKAEDDSKKDKKYILDMFPYPSGAGLHVGHPEGYTATDIYSRYLRMNGYNVLHPMGWDAFGLPAENYAIKTGTHPRAKTEENITTFKRQIKSLGLSYDWSREINTTDPAYYKWTQWIFLQLFKKGLAYEAVVPINWCPSCKTGLANEEVVSGKCERCGTAVEQKDMKQWMLKITAYADRLLTGVEKLDWPEGIKEMQRNWIGKSEGAEISFPIVIARETKQSSGKTRSPRSSGARDDIRAFTTRPDTLFGATYMVLAPEHELIVGLKSEIKNWAEVEKYIKQTQKKSNLQRTDLNKDKSGVELKGIKAINPANNEEIPVWIADYVLVSYGTGAIMAVPAHDERDFEFAKKFNLKIIEVISGGDIKKEAYIGDGKMINSEEFNEMDSREAKEKITKKVDGEMTVQYKLRDWVFSRQRYWGEPIPLVHCDKCGIVPLPESELPLELPDVKKYEPTGTGESPLASVSEWVKTSCPKCKAEAKRETNTMPQWAGSSWYWLRYIDPQNDKAIADKDKLKYWLPVDIYVGGAEHAVLHLLYARFWNMVLYDLKVVPVEEPFKKLINQGLILGPDGEKMSKSRGNVVNPDEIVEAFGADSLRLYEMFMGPLEDTKPWSTDGIKGVRRFLEKVVKLQVSKNKSKNNALLNKTIKKVTEDIEAMKFNTAISAMMIFINEVQKEGISKEDFSKFLIILAPFAPHLAEELFADLGNKESIFKQSWPKYDKKLIKDETIQLVVQINGKVRDNIEVETAISEDEAKEKALASEQVKKWIEGGKVMKVIFVKGRLINIVIK